MISRNKEIWLWVIGIGILFPLFFQLDGGIYRSSYPLIDSQGILTKLPLPISILVCLGGLLFVEKNLPKSLPAIALIFAMVSACFLSLWLGGDGLAQPTRKLILILQVLLPLSGLLLGLWVEDGRNIIAKAFLAVVLIVIPLQLFATWAQGGLILTHYLYAFSIYSHFQYVTLVFVCAFAYSMVTLWDQYKIWLCVLLVPMGIFVTASLSFLTIFAFFAFLAVFGVSKLWTYRGQSKVLVMGLLIGVSMLGAAGVVTYFAKMEGQRPLDEGQSGLFHGKFKSLLAGKMPPNVAERLGDWRLFGDRIFDSPKTVLVGHPEPMPRQIRSSPHSWYIEMVYNFGVIGLIPILFLIGYTAYLCWADWRTLASQTKWLAVIVFYLVVVDSNFKVTLRQPYPGLFAFFLWGLLLSRLRVTAFARENH